MQICEFKSAQISNNQIQYLWNNCMVMHKNVHVFFKLKLHENPTA